MGGVMISIRGNYKSYGRRSTYGEVAFVTLDEALELLESGLAEKIREELKDMKETMEAVQERATLEKKEYKKAQERAKKLGIIEWRHTS